MGLAAHGEPRHVDLMTKLLHPTSSGFEVDLTYFSYFMDGRFRFNERLVEALGPPRRPEAPIEDRHRHVADCDRRRRHRGRRSCRPDDGGGAEADLAVGSAVAEGEGARVHRGGAGVLR